MIYDFGDAEALRLMRAFSRIEDPQTRRIILAVVEAAGRGAAVKIRDNVEIRRTDHLS